MQLVALLLVVGCTRLQAAPAEPLCGPVCLIFCPFGNVLDKEGCPTCICNDDPCKYGNALTDGSGIPQNCGDDKKPCPLDYQCDDLPGNLDAGVCCPNKPIEAPQDACRRSCWSQGLVVAPSSDSTNCQCFDPCAAVRCLVGTVCTTTKPKGNCVQDACEPRPVCEPVCTGGRVIEPCFNGCPRDPVCGAELRPCDPIADMCVPTCVCPPDKPFVNSKDQCVKACNGGNGQGNI